MEAAALTSSFRISFPQAAGYVSQHLCVSSKEQDECRIDNCIARLTFELGALGGGSRLAVEG